MSLQIQNPINSDYDTYNSTPTLSNEYKHSQEMESIRKITRFRGVARSRVLAVSCSYHLLIANSAASRVNRRECTPDEVETGVSQGTG